MTEAEFPFEAARDLVGILRVVWTQERTHADYSRERLARITRVATALKNAIRLAAMHDPGTAPYRKAIVSAEAAVKALPSVFQTSYGVPDRVPEIVHTAGLRVVGGWRPWRKTASESKWAMGKRRG